MLRLDQLAHGTRGRIERIDGGTPLAARLMALAMLPGAAVQIIRTGPLGDPLLVKHDQGLLSLRRRDAAVVCVVPEN